VYTPGPLYPDTFLGRLRRLGGPIGCEDTLIDKLVAPIRRPLDRAWYAREGGLRELDELGTSVARSAPAANGKRVLVLSLRMWTHHVAYESLIGHALRLRGAEVGMLTCGGGQPICEVGWGRRVAPRPCDRCAYFTDRVVQSGGFEPLRLADEFPWGPSPNGAPGHADSTGRVAPTDATAASTAWFTKSSDPSQTTNGAVVTNDFEVSVAAVEASFARILDRFNPDVVFALNGLFASERAVRAVAADRGVRVVTYETAPRSGALLFGQRDAAAPEMATDDLADDQRAKPLTNAESEALDVYLQARVTGVGAHELYFNHPLEHDRNVVRHALGLDGGKRVISAFTNVAWDTALLGRDLAFDSQFEWLARAVQLIDGRDDSVLVIRVHPAEAKWGTAQPVERELIERIGRLPQNVVLIQPNEPLSSYGLLGITDLALCYTTTVGLEASARGVSVAVGGKTHYRGRGFTADINSCGELERAIADPPAMTPEQVDLARRYAFAFFFRLMIPFKHVRNVGGRLGKLPVSADELLPGRDPYLDFICDRILEGGDFFLPSALALPDAA
jgi:hypothetical protein